MGQGNWAKVPWTAFLDHRETNSMQRGVYCVYLFRADMSGLYLTFNQGVNEPKKRHGTKEARAVLRKRAGELRDLCGNLVTEHAFKADDEIDLRVSGGLGADYEHSTVAYKYYEKDKLPSDRELLGDVDAVLTVYDQYLESVSGSRAGVVEGGPEPEPPIGDFDVEAATWDVIRYIERRGFVFEPWQIAQYVAAVRTKPFSILAGITGTGKSKLPALVAEATGSEVRLVPVRPDWTDSADVLGYVDLQGEFRAGAVLEVVRAAMEEDDRYWVCIIDEMNLARVEQYLAEILSRMEDRVPAPNGGFQSKPLLAQPLREDDADWGDVLLPANLAIVGTVNMDETTHGFSRKVLDRAFTIELSDVDLTRWQLEYVDQKDLDPVSWPVAAWQPRGRMLADIRQSNEQERAQIERVIHALTQVNDFLSQAQLQVGYRTRDEIALFTLHAGDIQSALVTRQGEAVDALDLALHMKVLPRIVGGSAAVRRAVMQTLGWAHGGQPFESDEQVREVLDSWIANGRPGVVADAEYPRTAARLCLMWERFEAEGYTSFWL
jgi:hypothetical protein